MTELNQVVETEPVVTETEVEKMSKAEQARTIFVEMTQIEGTRRRDIIAAFMVVSSLTKDGAATYYYNCTKARKAGKL